MQCLPDQVISRRYGRSNDTTSTILRVVYLSPLYHHVPSERSYCDRHGKDRHYGGLGGTLKCSEMALVRVVSCHEHHCKALSNAYTPQMDLRESFLECRYITNQCVLCCGLYFHQHKHHRESNIQILHYSFHLR